MEAIPHLPRYVISCHGDMIPRRRFAMTAHDIAFLFVAVPGSEACSTSCDLALSEAPIIEKMILAASKRETAEMTARNGSMFAFEEPMLAAPSLYYKGKACPDHGLTFASGNFAIGIFRAPLSTGLAVNYGHRVRCGGRDETFKRFVESNREAVKFSANALEHRLGSKVTTLSELYSLLDGKITGRRHPGLYLCAFCRVTENKRFASSVARAELGPARLSQWVKNSLGVEFPRLTGTPESMKRKVYARANETRRVMRQRFTAEVYPELSPANRKMSKKFLVPTRGKVALNLEAPRFAPMLRAANALHALAKERANEVRGKYERRAATMENADPEKREKLKRFFEDYVDSMKGPVEIREIR